jgi:hypothetical protein
VQSHAAYGEGGLIYTYTEAANQAHCLFPIASARVLSLSPLELEELGRFIEASQGHYQPLAVTPQFLILAEQLFGQLQTDLVFDEVAWSFDVSEYGMDARLKMARRTDNRFFSLGLMWSVD